MRFRLAIWTTLMIETHYFRAPTKKMYDILHQFITMLVSIEIDILIEIAAVAIGLKLFFEKFFR